MMGQLQRLHMSVSTGHLLFFCGVNFTDAEENLEKSNWFVFVKILWFRHRYQTLQVLSFSSGFNCSDRLLTSN